MKRKFLVTVVLACVLMMLHISPLNAQWIQTNGPNGGEVICLAASGTNLYAGTSNSGVFLSTNNGTSWTAVNSGLTNTLVQSLAVSGTNLFAGTVGSGGGVFLSTNNGTSWTLVNSGLTNISIYALAVSGTNLFAGPDGGGVWRRPLSEIITSIHNTSSELPSEFLLQQNYPNPFNPTTTIKFQITISKFVKLSVFDMLGHEVATLMNEQLKPGMYETSFDGSSLNGGVYFYKISAGDFSETKRMLLIK